MCSQTVSKVTLKPSSSSVEEKKHDANKPLVAFYFVAFFISCLNFIPLAYHEMEHENSANSVEVKTFQLWLIIGLVVSIPLILEFFADVVVSGLNTDCVQNIVEHRFGHGLLLACLSLPSLLLMNGAALWGEIGNACFCSMCQALAVSAVLAKLQIFTHVYGCFLKFTLMISILVISQVILKIRDIRKTIEWTCLAVIFSFIPVLMSLILSRGLYYRLLLSRLKTEPGSIFSAAIYKILVLKFVFFLYLLTRLILTVISVWSDTKANHNMWGIVIRVVFVVLAVVLPGRCLRRGIVQMKV